MMMMLCMIVNASDMSYCLYVQWRLTVRAMKRKGKPGMVIDYLSTGVGGVVISLVALTGFVKLTGFGQTC